MKYLIPIVVLISLPVIVFAQCTNIEGDNARKLCTLVSDIAEILKWFGVALALVTVIVGGIMYMTAGSDEEKVKKARKTIVNGLIGAAIIFAAYFLVGMVQDFIESRF